MKKFFALLLAGLMLFSVAAIAEEAGFEETPIALDGSVSEDDAAYEDEVELTEQPLQVAAVYFQPVPMWSAQGADATGLSVEESNIHLEADIHWLENGYGYDKGMWFSESTVSYKIESEATGEVVAEGDFMKMLASDGPHYGANIKLDKSDVYKLTFTINAPEMLIHTDSETGPENHEFWDAPIDVEFVHWNYVVQEW